MEEWVGYKDWITGSNIPYLCLLVGFLGLIIILWLTMAYLLVAFKFGNTLWRRNRLDLTPEPQITAKNIQKTNESGTRDGLDTKENEAGASGNTQMPPQARIIVTKTFVAKMKIKKCAYVQNMKYMMLMLNIVQKMIAILLIFLLLTIMIHLTLLMLDTAAHSNNATTVFAEEDATKLTMRCSYCEYVNNDDKVQEPVSLSVPIKDGAKHTDDGAGVENGEVLEGADSVKGLFRRGARPTRFPSVYAP